MARIATGDWDAVIVALSQFTTLPVHPEAEADFIRRELTDYRCVFRANRTAVRLEANARFDTAELALEAQESPLRSSDSCWRRPR